MGTVYTSQAYGHLHIPIPLQHLEDRITLINALDTRFQTLTIPKRLEKNEDLQKRLKFMKIYIHHVATDVTTRYEEAVKPYNLTEDETIRNPRQLIIGGAALAGLISGAVAAKFTKSTNEKVIQQSQDVISHTIEESLVRTATNAKDISALNRTVYDIEEEFKLEFLGRERVDFETSILRATLITSLLHEEMSITIKVILHAQRNVLDPEAVDAHALQEALEKLNALAVKHGYESSAQRNQDLATLETSTMIDRTKKIIHLINHVPFYRPGQGMTLYQFFSGVSKTEMTDKNDNPLFIEVKPPRRFLALSQDSTTFMEMDDEELSGCTRKGTEYFCSYLARDKRGKPNCLLALYDKQIVDVKHFCKVSLTNHASHAERVTNELIFLTETDNMEITIDCPGKETNRSRIQGSRLITLEAGCTLNTRNQVIMRPKHEADVIVEGSFSNLIVPPSLWIYEDEHDDIQDAARHLLDDIGKSVPIEQVKTLARFKRQMQEARQSWGELDFSDWLLQSLLPSVSTGVLILVTICLIWKCGPTLVRSLCRRRRQLPDMHYHRDYSEKDIVDDVAHQENPDHQPLGI